MSSLKWMAQSVKEHIQDSTIENWKKVPQNIKESGRNFIGIPQTFKDYGVTGKLSQKELIDVIDWFHDNQLQERENWISERLLLKMNWKNLPVNVNKAEELYQELHKLDKLELTTEEKRQEIAKILEVIDVEALHKRLKQIEEYNLSLEDYEEIKKKLLEKLASQEIELTTQDIFNEAKKEVLEKLTLQDEKLTTQDTFSLERYNYTIPFWDTNIKDWHNLNNLILDPLPKPRPPKPGDKPKEPQKSDFENEKDFEHAKKKYENDLAKRQKEIKARNEWSGKIPRMKDITKDFDDLWPILNNVLTWWLEHFSALLERFAWAGVQHYLEFRYHPNILEVSPEEKNLMRNILTDVITGKKCFIVLNHETFANIPIAIIKFMKVAKEMGIENVNKYFTTMIWPLLATHRRQKIFLNSLSNILITHPVGNRILTAKRIMLIYQQVASQQLEKDLIEESSWWQLYFCASSWTRDIINYLNWEEVKDNEWGERINNDEEQEINDPSEQIFIPDASWWSIMVTCQKLKELHSKNPDLRIFTIWTNTTDLKRPDDKKYEEIKNSNLSKKRKKKKLKELVTTNNNKRNKNATVSMHISEVPLRNFSMEDILYWIKMMLQNGDFKEKFKGIPTEKIIDTIIDSIENDPVLKEHISKYIVDKNLSAEYIIWMLLKNITHPIPSKNPITSPKNLIKRIRNKGRKHYDCDKNGRPIEIQCAQTLTPEDFGHLKKYTKSEEYAHTWHLPKEFQINWKVDPNMVKSENRKNS